MLINRYTQNRNAKSELLQEVIGVLASRITIERGVKAEENYIGPFTLKRGTVGNQRGSYEVALPQDACTLPPWG